MTVEFPWEALIPRRQWEIWGSLSLQWLVFGSPQLRGTVCPSGVIRGVSESSSSSDSVHWLPAPARRPHALGCPAYSGLRPLSPLSP